MENREKLAEYKKEYRLNNKDKYSAYQKKNRPIILAWKKSYRIKNKEKIAEAKKLWDEKNKERIIAYTKAYRENNKKVIKKRYKAWYEKNNKKRFQERYYNNIPYKLSMQLRHRLYLAIKGGQKKGSAVRDLGCTIPELIIHLEKQFQSGMSWDNWTTDGWHIDHIIPLFSFDLTDREQLLKACHYTNLQPLWALDNIRKGAKLTP